MDKKTVNFIDSYSSLPLGGYLRILDLIEDKECAPEDLQPRILAVLSGLTEDEVLDLPLEDYMRGAIHRLPGLRQGRAEELRGAPLVHARAGREKVRRGLRPGGGACRDTRAHERAGRAFAAGFFFKLVGEINAAYPVLFNARGMEGDAVGDEDEDGGEAGEAGGFGRKWGWISCIDAVSETCRCPWETVWAMSAVEFLNILCYRKDKNEKEKMEIEKWKRAH